MRTILRILGTWALLASVASGAVFGTVRGIVHDPTHRPIEAARVTLHSLTSDWSRSQTTNDEGEFVFQGVPIGAYTVRIEADAFTTVERKLNVTSVSAGVLHFPLELAASRESVEVVATAGTVAADSATTSTMIGRADIAQTPGADRTNSMAMITDYVPGAYMIHDQLHVRGGHQVTWAVDGVPVPNTNIASNVGPQFDPKDIDYLEVQRGGFSSEYGDRAYGVFNIAPRTGFERNNEADLLLSYGTFRQTNDQFNFGSHTSRFAYYASVNGNRTDLGLETPGPAVLHDQGNGLGAFGSIVFNAGPSDQLRLVASARRDYYQVPNDEEQQAAGVRDTDRESDAFANFSWVRTLSPAALLTVSPFYHFNRANFVGGPRDPVSARDDRSSHYAGAQASVAAESRRHSLRAGIYGFRQWDVQTIRVSSDGATVIQAQNPTGWLSAVFLEDRFRAASWLTLSGGVRLTHFAGRLSENAASPRLGVTVALPVVHATVRGSYGRFYQAPPLSSISGPLLEVAASEGLGLLPLRGERDEEYEFGATLPFHGWELDAADFSTHARNFFDHDALGNSNIFLPLTIDTARIWGQEVTLRSPSLFGRAQARLAYSHQHAEGQGAVSGGLTDFSPPEGRFLLDHDQRHTLAIASHVTLPRNTWFAATVALGSGFADENAGHLPGRTLVDLAAGRDFGERWTVAVNATNVANRRVLLDNSPAFGGTHYVEPRQVYVQLRYRFHY